MACTFLGISAYLSGAGVFARCFVCHHAEQYPVLNRCGVDTVFCLFFAALWPVATLMLAFDEYLRRNSAKPSNNVFTHWHNKDRNS